MKSILALFLALGLQAVPPALGPDHTFVPTATWSDAQGMSHTRYQHYFQGRRVWGSTWMDHAGAGSQPATEGLRLAAVPPASGLALAAPPAGAEAIWWPDTVEVPAGPDPDALHMDSEVIGLRAAFFVPAPSRDTPSEDDCDLILDAQTLETILAIPILQADQPAKGTGLSLYRGTVDLDIAFTGSRYLLKDLTRGTGGLAGSNVVTDAGYRTDNPTVYANATPTWGDGLPERDGVATSSPNGQTMAVDMAKGIQDTWDFYATILGRKGPDGTGRALTGVAHLGGSSQDNAFWSGNGTNLFAVVKPVQFMPLSTLMILAHEISHGLTEYTARLTYAGESGGLNEASSDIFGAMAATWVANGRGATIGNANTDWSLLFYTQGATFPSPPVVIRNMRKPTLGQSPDSLNAWKPGIGKLDVHVSSGPMNRAFTFLCAGASTDPGDIGYSTYLPGGMAGIGNDKATAIWYRTLATYLTPSSAYKDARAAALSAAADLYGAGSTEQAAVAKAFAAINVGPPDPPVPPSTLSVTASVSLQGRQAVFTASSPAALTAVNFIVDGIPVGTVTQAPFTLTLDASRALANGAHVLTADAFDGAGNRGAAAGVSFTLTNAVQQLLKNPGFEAGAKGWSGSVTAIRLDPKGALPFEGWRWVRCEAGAGLQSLFQAVQIPPGSLQADLVFQMRAQSVAAVPGWVAGVQVTTASGALLAHYRLPSDAPQGVWVQNRLDLSAFAGQTVRVTCTADLPSGTPAYVDFDDVRLLAGTQAPVRVSVTPASATVYPSTAPVTFTAAVSGAADATVTWSAPRGGTVSAGVFTPPQAPGSYAARATSSADPGAFWDGVVLVRPVLHLFPATATVAAGSTATLSLAAAPGTAPVLSLSGGPSPGFLLLQADPTQVVFVAPATLGTYTLLATDPATGATASAVLTVDRPSPISLKPAKALMSTQASRSFTVVASDSISTFVDWSVIEGTAGGTITPGGFYTAPSTPGVYHVLARTLFDPSISAIAEVTVAAGLVVDPPQATLLTGISLPFGASGPGTASPSVTWSSPDAPGAMNGPTFTAPGKPGTYTIVATSTTDSTLTGKAKAIVKTTDFNGNGQVVLDWGDLAFLADAWGASPAVDPADLNGDGVVDDQDATIFFTRFGGN